jgi:hypothetical protein
MFERYPDLHLQLQLAHFEPLQLDQNPTIEHLNLPLENLDIIYVYGLSDGHPFLELEEWLEAASNRHLIFLEDDLSSLHRLSVLDWSERMLSHPQVHLKFLHYPRDWILELCAKEFPSERIAVTTLKKKTALFRSIKLSLLRKTVLWNSLTSESLSGHLIHRNIFANFKKLPRSFYVNQMKDAFAGKPAVICGAGPSLSGVIEDLSGVQDKALIIACGSALSALSHFKLKPHFGIAIDPNAREKECLQGCSYRDLPLIYGNRLYPEVFELFDGPYGYLRSPTGSPLEKAIEKELGLHEADIGTDLGREALSVTTLALSMATFWGCNPIILAGVDLAYSGGDHYVEGVPVHLTRHKEETRAGEQLIYRKGAQGRRTATLVKWVMERETIDAYAKQHPKTTFLNATGKGLGFFSIPYKPLSELNLPSLSINLKQVITQYPVPVTDGQLSQTLADFKGSFERCLDFAKQLQEEKEGSGKAILYEDELTHEKAFQLTLAPALDALERIYSLNIELPFSRHKWKFLQEIIEEYLLVLT